MSDTSKEISFTVHMTAGILYDYMINHAYSGASGILGTCFGFLGIIFYLKTNFVLYLILGIVLVLYLPINLKYKSFVQMKMTESFQKPLEYQINQDGITVAQDGQEESVPWSQCCKAVSTKQSIVVYTGKQNASIFPRKDLADHLPALVATIAENMDPKKIKIRN